MGWVLVDLTGNLRIAHWVGGVVVLPYRLDIAFGPMLGDVTTPGWHAVCRQEAQWLLKRQ
jgi:hypothetical protein